MNATQLIQLLAQGNTSMRLGTLMHVLDTLCIKYHKRTETDISFDFLGIYYIASASYSNHTISFITPFSDKVKSFTK